MYCNECRCCCCWLTPDTGPALLTDADDVLPVRSATTQTDVTAAAEEAAAAAEAAVTTAPMPGTMVAAVAGCGGRGGHGEEMPFGDNFLLNDDG